MASYSKFSENGKEMLRDGSGNVYQVLGYAEDGNPRVRRMPSASAQNQPSGGVGNALAGIAANTGLGAAKGISYAHPGAATLRVGMGLGDTAANEIYERTIDSPFSDAGDESKKTLNAWAQGDTASPYYPGEKLLAQLGTPESPGPLAENWARVQQMGEVDNLNIPTANEQVDQGMDGLSRIFYDEGKMTDPQKNAAALTGSMAHLATSAYGGQKLINAFAPKNPTGWLGKLLRGAADAPLLPPTATGKAAVIGAPLAVGGGAIAAFTDKDDSLAEKNLIGEIGTAASGIPLLIPSAAQGAKAMWHYAKGKIHKADANAAATDDFLQGELGETGIAHEQVKADAALNQAGAEEILGIPNEPGGANELPHFMKTANKFGEQGFELFTKPTHGALGVSRIDFVGERGKYQDVLERAQREGIDLFNRFRTRDADAALEGGEAAARTARPESGGVAAADSLISKGTRQPGALENILRANKKIADDKYEAFFDFVGDQNTIPIRMEPDIQKMLSGKFPTIQGAEASTGRRAKHIKQMLARLHEKQRGKGGKKKKNPVVNLTARDLHNIRDALYKEAGRYEISDPALASRYGDAARDMGYKMDELLEGTIGESGKELLSDARKYYLENVVAPFYKNPLVRGAASPDNYRAGADIELARKLISDEGKINAVNLKSLALKNIGEGDRHNFHSEAKTIARRLATDYIGGDGPENELGRAINFLKKNERALDDLGDEDLMNSVRDAADSLMIGRIRDSLDELGKLLMKPGEGTEAAARRISQGVVRGLIRRGASPEAAQSYLRNRAFQSLMKQQGGGEMAPVEAFLKMADGDNPALQSILGRDHYENLKSAAKVLKPIFSDAAKIEKNTSMPDWMISATRYAGASPMAIMTQMRTMINRVVGPTRVAMGLTAAAGIARGRQMSWKRQIALLFDDPAAAQKLADVDSEKMQEALTKLFRRPAMGTASGATTAAAEYNRASEQ